MWVAAFVSLVLYIPLYLCLFGYIEVDEDRWWLIRVPRMNAATCLEADGPYIKNKTPRPAKEAFLMLLFVLHILH